jgi:ribonuclease T1
MILDFRWLERATKEDRMKPKILWPIVTLAFLVSISFGCLANVPEQTAQEPGTPTFGRPQIEAVTSPAEVLKNAEVVDFGKVIFTGRMDVNPTLERVRMGNALEHRNDGAIFQNRERKLPSRGRGYYREFIVAMKGVPFPGPVRVIVGLKGEVFFTGDHYKSFTRVR